MEVGTGTAEATLDEVGVVTVAASIREVEVDLEASMVTADVMRAWDQALITKLLPEGCGL